VVRQRAQVGEAGPDVGVEEVDQQLGEPGGHGHAGGLGERGDSLGDRGGAAALGLDHGGRLAPRRRAEQPQAQQRAEGEHVGAGAAAAGQDLGREEPGGAAAEAADLPEVGEEQAAGGGHEHVAGADVAVVGAGLVDRPERVSDGGGLGEGAGDGDGTGRERLAVDVPGDQPQVAERCRSAARGRPGGAAS
jgi:hypothetical protein